MLPDYMEGCPQLASELKEAFPAMTVRCGNTTAFIEDRVRKRVAGWGGFLTPLSPGAPGRTAVLDQYFSKTSNETWLAGARDPERNFYRVGFGKSLVTVDGETVCGIRGNPMGLSDLLVSDLVPCR